MTQGDYLEMMALAMLYGLAFTIPAPRWQLFMALTIMALNMLAGRIFILLYTDAYVPCSLLQFIAAVAIISASRSILMAAQGLLYATMVIGGGATALGYLSQQTSIGIFLNFWTVMSVATYCQFVVILFHVFLEWQKHGILAGINRLGRN